MSLDVAIYDPCHRCGISLRAHRPDMDGLPACPMGTLDASDAGSAYGDGAARSSEFRPRRGTFAEGHALNPASDAPQRRWTVVASLHLPLSVRTVAAIIDLLVADFPDRTLTVMADLAPDVLELGYYVEVTP